MISSLNKKIILITGGTGSWGNELVTQLLNNYNPKEIRIYSRGELPQVQMKRKFQNEKLNFIIGDVRDRQRLITATKNVDYIFHLAALKHVPVCEENPWEAVQTNIIGIQNVIDAAIENKVTKVVDVSTDKAVDPLNLYGVTKACGEKLIIAANRVSDTRFVCVRGGNVLGTNGSVIPLFKEQISRINQITITDPNMTRFLMRVEDAIKLVLKATIDSIGGEIFVMKTPACNILDLAKVMIKNLGNNKTSIKNIGIRAGEKLYEVLVSKYEINRTIELKEYYIVLPQIHMDDTASFYKNKKHTGIKDEYSSNNTKFLNKTDLEELLKKDNWLSKQNDQNDNLFKLTTTKSLKNIPKSEGW